MLRAILLFFVLFYFSACNFSAGDNEQIKRCFANYKKAILSRQGKLGIECVDSKTINYYSQTLQKVIKYDSLQLETVSPIDKYIILKIRQNIPYDSIVRLDGKSLLANLINHGISGNLNISLYNIDDIQIEGDSASAEKVINGKRSPNRYKFYKEGNSWKFSVFSQSEYELYNWGIKQSIQKSNLSEDEFILNYIKTTSQHKLKDNIWHPLLIK
jgi:hypothetical protein